MSVTPFGLEKLVDFLLPSPCLGCSQPVAGGAGPLGLCRRCCGRLSRAPQPACATCGRPLEAASPPPGFRCGACRAKPPAFDALHAAWSYEEPLKEVIQALKFRRLDYLGRHLGEALASRLGAELSMAEVVVPVPLHWRRHLLRGFNQAERIARALAGSLGLPLARALVRARSAPPQSSLNREERLRNLARCFRPRARGRIAGRRVLLVDDVVTTGATLHLAAKALRAGGAAAVVAVAAARTPAPGTMRPQADAGAMVRGLQKL